MLRSSWKERYLYMGNLGGMRYHKILVDHGNGKDYVTEPQPCGEIPKDSMHLVEVVDEPDKRPMAALPKGFAFTVKIPEAKGLKQNTWTFYSPSKDLWKQAILDYAASHKRRISEAGKQMLAESLQMNAGPAAFLDAAAVAEALPPPPPPADGEAGDDDGAAAPPPLDGAAGGSGRPKSLRRPRSKKKGGTAAILAKAKAKGGAGS
eukprot:g3454.t1